MSANSLSLQQMDQEIINNLKSFHGKEIVCMTLAYLEEEKKFFFKSFSTVANVSSKISILDAVNFFAKIWRAVKETTILNFYRKAGFFTLSSSMNDDNEEDFTSDTL